MDNNRTIAARAAKKAEKVRIDGLQKNLKNLYLQLSGPLNPRDFEQLCSQIHAVENKIYASRRNEKRPRFSSGIRELTFTSVNRPVYESNY